MEDFPDKNSRFRVGKLNHEYLEKMLKNYVTDLETNDDSIIMGSKIGEDAAVIDIGDKYLVAKTDPITFATNDIGYYVIHVNINDLVCTGAIPKYFQSTILLPDKKTSKEMIQKIFRGIHDTAKSMNVAVIGGHTEITSDLNRPIVVGCLIGEVEKGNLVMTSGAEAGDDLILTKGIFIEGTAIIAREKENFLREKGYTKEFIEKCKSFLYDPGISVCKEAMLAVNNFPIKSMHDPTEGGLGCGIAEMAISSKNGVLIDESMIKVFSESLELAKLFKIDPMNTISSGSLLIAINEEKSKDLIKLMRKNNVYASKIGHFLPEKEGMRIKKLDGTINKLSYTEIDDITKVF